MLTLDPGLDPESHRERLAAYVGRSRAPGVGALLELRWDGSRATLRGDASCYLGRRPDPDGGLPEVYAGWHWDGSRLRAFNDRYGFFPLFYCRDGDRLLISPSLERILVAGAPSDFDDDALAVFVRKGLFLGEDTPFRAIRAVPPAARFTWHKARLDIAGQYANMPVVDRPWSEAVDGYIELFRAAIRRTLQPGKQVVLPLSGGKDSRHILFALCEAGHPPEHCVTFHQLPWQEPNWDVPLAAELTSAAGVRHVILDQPRDGLRAELRKNVATHFCSDEHTHYMVLADHLRGSDRVVYDGIAGDVLSESKVRSLVYTELFEQRRITELAAKELGPEGYLPKLLSPNFLKRFSRERALARLEEEMRRHVEAPNPFGSFRFWNRTRREIAMSPYAILAAHEVVAPYLDRDLFDFLAALPARTLLRDRLHTAAIRAGYPQFAAIPFDYERVSGVDPALVRRYSAQASLQRAVRRATAGWTARLGLYCAVARKVAAIRKPYLLQRSAVAVVRQRDDAVPWMPRVSLYLTQLQQLVSRR